MIDAHYRKIKTVNQVLTNEEETMTRSITALTPTEFSRIVQQYENKYEELDSIYLILTKIFRGVQNLSCFLIMFYYGSL